MICLNRRQLLSAAARGLLSAAAYQALRPSFVMADPLGATTGPARFVIFVNMAGGVDVLNMMPFYSGSAPAQAMQSRRPTLHTTVNPATGMRANDTFQLGFHSSLAPLYPLYTAGDMKAIFGYANAAILTDGTLSHELQQRVQQYGTARFGPQSNGWLARAREVFVLAPEQTIAYGMPWQSAFAHSNTRFSPLVAQSTETFQYHPLHTESGGQAETDRILSFAKRIREIRKTKVPADSATRKVIDAFDALDDSIEFFHSINQYNGLASTYPNTNFGNAMKNIAKTISVLHSEPQSRIFYTGFTGQWDTHDTQATNFPVLADDLAQGIRAFADDMKRLPGSVWDRVLVVTTSEFGRRVYENGGRGTDHGHGGISFALGGGLRTGGVVATYNPATVNWAQAEMVPVGVHFQNLFAQSFAFLGLDGDRLWDRTEYIHTDLGIV